MRRAVGYRGQGSVVGCSALLHSEKLGQSRYGWYGWSGGKAITVNTSFGGLHERLYTGSPALLQAPRFAHVAIEGVRTNIMRIQCAT